MSLTAETFNKVIDSGIIDLIVEDTTDIEQAVFLAAKKNPEYLGIAMSMFNNERLIALLATIFIAKYQQVAGVAVFNAFLDNESDTP